MPDTGYQLLFDKAPEALLAVVHGSLAISAVNDCALKLLGWRRDKPGEYRLYDVLRPADLEKLLDTISRRTGPFEVLNCGVRDVTGRVHDSDLMVTAIPASRGEKAATILLSIRDASERTNMQEQLRQAQKMEALGMLSGGIAHDFNNLLTIISGYSQMLMASPQMISERDRTALEQVLKASERAADLTSQLLAFSRRQTVQPKVIEINRMVDQTATMLRRLIGEDVDLRIEKSPEAGRIHADGGQIQQMLMNLAINSRDAMPEGGTLRILTGNVELDEEFTGHHLGARPGSYVMLEVSDTGTGMDEATRSRVFEPFFTTKPQGKGTGLGLSTVYGLVRQCGGSIDLYSQPGHGTTFRVYLPRVEDELSEDRVAPSEPRGGHETILLVEDEEGVRRMVHVALERRGYRVLVAASGADGLDVARNHEGPIDLLISDMIMPQMNGRELAQRLLTERPSVRVLFISGYAGNTLQTSGTLTEETPFLQKPFAPVALTTKVREILDSGEAAEGAGRH